MARCTSTAVRPAARSRPGSSITWICRLRPPMIVTCPTPETFSSAWRISWSANSVTSRIGRVDSQRQEQHRRRVGIELADDRALGPFGQIVAGSVETCSRTSCAATLTSLSSLKLTMTCETPSVEIERSSSMPLMVLIASSILSESSVSISSGAAPGSSVIDGDDRQVDVGEAVDVELLVADDADDDDEQDQHGREDRAADADTGEPLHGVSSLHLARRRARRGSARRPPARRP